MNKSSRYVTITYLGPCAPLEVTGFDVVRDSGFRNALALRRATSAVVLPVPGASPSRAVGEASWLPVSAERPPLFGSDVATAIAAPVIPLAALTTRLALVTVRGTPLSIVGAIVVPAGVAAMPRAVIIPIKALASAEAVTVAVPATPG